MFHCINTLFVDIWLASTFWWLWIILSWTWEWKCFFDVVLSVLLDVYTEVGLLSPVFSMESAPFYSFTSSAQTFQFLHINTWYFLFGVFRWGFCLFALVVIHLVGGDISLWFGLAFLWWLIMVRIWVSFHMLVGHL